MTTTWQPYREPLWATLLRTGTIAIIIGGIFAWKSGDLARWPIATLLTLWPTFGGHWVEIAFLNGIRPRLAPARGIQIAARLATWFAGGILLALGMALTATALGVARPGMWSPQWLAFAGVGFIVVECVVHLVLQVLGRPSFFNGRG